MAHRGGTARAKSAASRGSYSPAPPASTPRASCTATSSRTTCLSAPAAAASRSATSGAVVARSYRAPELLLGSTDYDAGVDTWAIGCIVAELLAGGLLFCGDTIWEQLGEVLGVLGTNDIREWSRCPDRLPGGCGPTSFLREMFPSCPELAMVTGRPALSEAGFEVLSGLLRCNPEKRMTAAGALKCRWFDEASL
ncbi:unnamed protein product [Urochloa humidicola]